MAQFTFTERGELERGFAEVFRREIAPTLERHEHARRAARRNALATIGLSLVAGGSGGGLAYSWGYDRLVTLSPLAGVVGALAARGHYQKTWSAGLGSEVLPVICRFLGDMEHGAGSVEVQDFVDLGVVPEHTVAQIDDRIAGRHRGLGYALAEVRLLKRRFAGRRVRLRTVFRGLLLRIELMEDVPAIRFAREGGDAGSWFPNLFTKGRTWGTKVAVPHREFETVYETRALDPKAAVEFITPAFSSGLLALALAETGVPRALGAATRGRGFYLALPQRRNFLALGTLFTPLARIEEDIHQCIADLALPRRVIDTLSGRES